MAAGPLVTPSSANVAVPVSSVATTSPRSVGVHAASIITNGIAPANLKRSELEPFEQSSVFSGLREYEISATDAVTNTGVRRDPSSSQTARPRAGQVRLTKLLPCESRTLMATGAAPPPPVVVSVGPSWANPGSADANVTLEVST